MPRGYRPALQKTAFDLHVERDCVPWYYKAIALGASWLVLGGYILFPLVFTSDVDNLRASRTTLTSLAAALFIVGYVAISVTAALSRSILFCFDAVLLPILTSSVVGLVMVVFSHALHKVSPVSNIYYIVPLTLASLSSIVSGVLVIWTYNRIDSIRRSDVRRKVRITREEQSAWPGVHDMQELLSQRRRNRGSTGSISNMIPEDEQQRQQLLRLLLSREAARAPSPDYESTYRIDLPDSSNRNDYLRVPNPANPADDNSLPDSGTRFQLSQLLGGFHRARSHTADSFVDPRQRRREEIERGLAGRHDSSPQALDGWPGSPPATQQYTPSTPGMLSPPSGGGMMRYA